MSEREERLKVAILKGLTQWSEYDYKHRKQSKSEEKRQTEIKR